MRIAFAGTPGPAVPSLDALVGSTHEVVAVITRPDAAQGRSKRLVPSPVAQRAAELRIPVLKPTSAKSPEFANELAALNLDAVAVVAYGALLPQSLLDLIPHGWINLHFSLLPRWRGAAPVQHAIWAGDDVTGVTTFRIVQALDAGPVFGTLERPLTGTETSGALLDELAHSGARLLVDTFDQIAAGAKPTPQPDEGITIAPKLTVEGAAVDWTRPADEVSRLIRANSPAPGAWSLLEGQRFKVLDASSEPTDQTAEAPLSPRELRTSKRALLCGTGTTPLVLTRVQPFGKAAMAGADWARGANLMPNTVLTSPDEA